MSDENEKENEVLTDEQRIRMRRTGNTDVLTVPANWTKTFPFFKVDPVEFQARIEKTPEGKILLVLERIKPEVKE